MTNQWGNSYGQGTTLATITPALQSCVLQLNNTYSVGGGSGTPTAGNWLFTIASWTQDPSIAEVHVGVGDDIHSWWRQYPASSATGNTRTSISYTPNTARAPGYVYVAPDDQIAAINVLVVEVSGLGPWDTVVGPNTNYAAAATSLSLSLSAPGAASFFIGAVGGDTTAATQTFAPGGYTTLHTLSQTNGIEPPRGQRPHLRVPGVIVLVAVRLRVHQRRQQRPVRVPHRRLHHRNQPGPRRRATRTGRT